MWLVRHGEAHNPAAVVYGRLPGFQLSERGARQARALASRIADTGVVAIYCSPLQRARQTAEIIAARCGLPDPVVLNDLTEWELGSYWSGRSWEWVKKNRPREWETYIAHPASIDFIEETLERLAQRMQRALRQALEATQLSPPHAVCLVSHADPIKALLLSLAGRDLDDLHSVQLDVGSGILVEVEADSDTVRSTRIIDQVTNG